MSFRVERYTEAHRQSWQDLWSKAHNATIFHDLRFLSYHLRDAFRTCHLLFFRDNRPISFLPAAMVREGGLEVLKSPYGASWGGLLLPPDLGVEEVSGLVHEMIGFSQELGADRIEITLPPVIYLEGQDQVQEFCLLASGFTMVRAELTEVIHLPGFTEEALPSPYRRGARKAARMGVRVELSEDYETFHEILRSDRAGKQVEPTHSLDDLKRIAKLCPGRLKLFMASGEEGIVGGTLLFVAGRNTVLNMYLCQIPPGRQIRVANLLVNDSAMWAKQEGFDWLDMGTSSIRMTPNWGLSRFKEGFLGKGYIRPTFILDQT